MDSFDIHTAIIGSGFSGLGMAIRLKQEGIEDFTVLERGDDIGGTWHYNTYPGCACDVPSHLYSFSFAPNPKWSETYSRQPEIRDYIHRVADEYGLRDHVRLNCAVEGIEWDEDAAGWRIDTSEGPLRARVVVAGMGPLAEPKIPPLEGLEDFEGEAFHSARWRHDYDLAGKRVAAVGTGASAIQFVPEIQKQAAQVHVVQRTAPWIMPHPNREIRGWEKRLYDRFPALQKLVRGGIYAGRELFVLGFVKDPRIMGVAERIARRHMEHQISDPELLEKVTPGYTIGCKRILPSNRWYRALSKPNVELLTGGIERVTRNTIVTGDGEEREVDAIIFGTGFQVTDMPVARMVRGPGGKTLDEAWQGSPKAHLGATIPGFPNLFVLLGPNTGLGHSSMVYMIESQVAYVMDALRYMDRNGADTVQVRADAAERYNADIDERMQGTVWNTGCASWYLDQTGRNATLWPDWTFRFRRRTAQFDPADFELGSTTSSTPERGDAGGGARKARAAGMSARVLITGASGGIGSAAMAELRARGATVVGLDLRADEAAGVLACDLRDDDAVRRAVAAAVERLGGLDVLINNAGLGVPQSAGRSPDADALAVLEVNLIAPWRVTAAALPHLRAARGRVVNVASGLAHLAVPFATAYCMSKRGLVAYSDALRLEHGDEITVTTVYPGYIRTGIHDAARTSGVALEGAVPAERVEDAARALTRAALGRPARDLATTRAGAVQYFLARRSPRRLLDALTNRAVRRMVRRGGFSERGLAGELSARLSAR